MPSHTVVVGEGPTSILRFTWTNATGPTSAGIAYITNTLYRSPSAENSDIRLSNFVLRGAGSGKPSGPNIMHPLGLVQGISLYSVRNVALTHLAVTRITGVAVSTFGAQHVVAVENKIYNTGRGGIVAGWFLHNLADVVIMHNLVVRAGDDGVAIAGDVWSTLPTAPRNTSMLPREVLIADNRIIGWRTNTNGLQLGSGIDIEAADSTRVVDNYVQDTVGPGIRLTGSQIVPNSHDFDPSTHEPWISQHDSIVGNVIVRPGSLASGSQLGQHLSDAGIFVAGAAHIEVTRNRLIHSRWPFTRVRDCALGCRVQTLPD